MPKRSYSDFQREKIFKLREEGKSYRQISSIMGIQSQNPASLSTQVRLRQERIDKKVYNPEWYEGCEDFKGQLNDLENENPKFTKLMKKIELIPSVPDPNTLSDWELLKNFRKHYPRRK